MCLNIHNKHSKRKEQTRTAKVNDHKYKIEIQIIEYYICFKIKRTVVLKWSRTCAKVEIKVVAWRQRGYFHPSG